MATRRTRLIRHHLTGLLPLSTDRLRSSRTLTEPYRRILSMRYWSAIHRDPGPQWEWFRLMVMNGVRSTRSLVPLEVIHILVRPKSIRNTLARKGLGMSFSSLQKIPVIRPHRPDLESVTLVVRPRMSRLDSNSSLPVQGEHSHLDYGTQHDAYIFQPIHATFIFLGCDALVVEHVQLCGRHSRRLHS